MVTETDTRQRAGGRSERDGAIAVAKSASYERAVR
jgi:hypothetical protein